jgi:hypothetical protein
VAQQHARTLSLAGNEISCRGAAILVAPLHAGGVAAARLETLDLSGNNVRDFGAAFLAEALRASATLVSLDVASNLISASGRAALDAAADTRAAAGARPYVRIAARVRLRPATVPFEEKDDDWNEELYGTFALIEQGELPLRLQNGSSPTYILTRALVDPNPSKRHLWCLLRALTLATTLRCTGPLKSPSR